MLGGYEVVSEIARGGTSVVYRARSKDGREVALKVLAPITDDAALEVFEREKRGMEQLRDIEGFVPVLDSGIAERRPYFVQPLLLGGTLRERLRGGPLAVAEALAVARALARSLGRAHARGVV